jgi:thiamine transport system permease protein
MTLSAGLLSAAMAALVLGTALVLAVHADGFALRSADLAAVTFTLKQAALSALVSTLVAMPLARALARRRFQGRAVLVALMSAPFLLPVVVAVVGILSVYGREGIVNQLLAAMGLPPVSIFGLQGVVLTNVFFNLPLATRMLLNGWAAIPAERFRLAETLGLPPPGRFRHIELPMLRDLLPGAFTVVFLLCLTSFVVSLTLGGGPRATTLELAIYQSLRFDFDLGRAALLAGVQFLICTVVVVAAGRLTLPSGLGAGPDRTTLHPAPLGWRRAADGMLLVAATGFLSLPLLNVLADGLPSLSSLPAPVWQAALRSVLIAVTSSTLATVSGLCLALAVARDAGSRRWIEVAAMLPMAASGLVLGTGMFLILRPLTTPETVALPVTVLVNMTLALPFLYRLLLPEALSLHEGYDRLSATLGLTGLARLRLVTLPRLARPLGLGAGIAAALSMGDLGIIALFAGENTATLPLMVQRLAGAYRMDLASAASLLLVTLGFALFVICDLAGRHAAP